MLIMKTKKIKLAILAFVGAVMVVCLGGYSTRQKECDEILGTHNIMASLSEYPNAKEVVVYTYNDDWQVYEKCGTWIFYKNDNDELVVDDMKGHVRVVYVNHDHNIYFQYWAFDEDWETYYYFD